MKKICIIVLSTVICFCLSIAYAEKMRPVRLKIIDKATKTPIEGVRVIYYLDAVRANPRVFFIFPSPDPNETYRTLHAEIKYTDKNGMVAFKPVEFKLKRHERIHEENIYVNLDFNYYEYISFAKKLDSITEEIEMKNLYLKTAIMNSVDPYVVNPLAKYKGVHLYNSLDYPLRENAVYEKYDFFDTERLVTMKTDIVVVELKKRK